MSISLGNLVQPSSKTLPSIRKYSSSVFTMTPQEIAIWIDEKSRIIFPLGFVIFNFIYWFPLIMA